MMNLPCTIILSIMAISHAQNSAGYEFTESMADDTEQGRLFKHRVSQLLKEPDGVVPESVKAFMSNAAPGVAVPHDVQAFLETYDVNGSVGELWDLFQRSFLFAFCEGQNRFDMFMCKTWMCSKCIQSWCVEKCTKVQKDFPSCRCRHWPRARQSYSDVGDVGLKQMPQRLQEKNWNQGAQVADELAESEKVGTTTTTPAPPPARAPFPRCDATEYGVRDPDSRGPGG